MKKLRSSVWLTILSINFINAQNIDVPQGLIVIDMGVVPQTIGNGLKPYGFVYSLIKNFNTSVIWSINPTKSKDNPDFSVNGREFKGGTFIISAEFLAPSVLSEIAAWESIEVINHTTSSDMKEVIKKSILNQRNESIETDHFKNTIKKCCWIVGASG